MHYLNVGKLPKRAVNTINDIVIMARKIFFKAAMFGPHLSQRQSQPAELKKYGVEES